MRSDKVTKGVEKAPMRSLFYAMGYTKEELDEILVKLSEETEFGIILRAKGMLPAADGTWLYFDLVPGEYEIRNGAPDYTGRLCVIGSKMDTDKLEKLFKL